MPVLVQRRAYQQPKMQMQQVARIEMISTTIPPSGMSRCSLGMLPTGCRVITTGLAYKLCSEQN